MGLTVTVLGCSGSYPPPGQACSGYLVRTERTTVWLDAGAGTLANLQRHADFAELDGILLSHSHPDHWVDVLPFHNVCRFIAPREGLPVWSPAEVRRLAGEVQQELEPAFDWTAVTAADEVVVGDLRVTFSRTDHGPETLAMRVEGAGRVLGYTADTGPAWALGELGSDLDLALCEATFKTEWEGMAQHLSARQAGVAAREAGAGRLLLTHLQPGVDPDRSRAEAAEAFGGPVQVATINETYEV